MRPFLGNVAVGAGSTHAGAVRVMHGGFVFFVNVVPHLVAGDTKGFSIGYLHGSVEAPPEDNPGHEESRNSEQGELSAPLQNGFPGRDERLSVFR
jgi:hypothetical protein